MKKLLLFLVIALLVCTAALYFDFMPAQFYNFVDDHAPARISQIVHNINRSGESDAAREGAQTPPQRQFAQIPDQVVSRQLHDVTRRVIEGVLALEQPIEVSISLPQGDDDQVTDYFIGHVELAVDIIRREIPEVFWLSLETYRIEWNANMTTRTGVLSVFLNYRHSEAEVAQLSVQLHDVIDEIIRSAPDDPLDRITFFNDWIVANTVYAQYLVDSSGSIHGNEHGFNIDGIFLRGSAVCEGYSKAFKLLSDLSGIPNVIIYGEAKGENHSWNLVYLEGLWYLVDVTWNNPIGQQDVPRHTFFLLGSESVVDGLRVAEIFTDDGAGYPPLAPTGFFE